MYLRRHRHQISDGSIDRPRLALDTEVIGDTLKIVFSFVYNKLALLVYQDQVLKKTLSSPCLPPDGPLPMDSFLFTLLQQVCEFLTSLSWAWEVLRSHVAAIPMSERTFRPGQPPFRGSSKKTGVPGPPSDQELSLFRKSPQGSGKWTELGCRGFL